MQLNTLYEKLFYQTLRIRLVEERIAKVYPHDVIQSPVHLSIGQEAIATGTCAHLNGHDLLFSNYRGHAFYLAKGGDLKQMIAELYGKAGGCGRGKAGSMHLFSKQANMMLSSAVVSTTIPHAVGAALAAKKKKKDQIAVVVFGDGATEEGVFHESLNLASLYEVPVIFICENNGLAIHSPIEERQRYLPSEMAKTYGMPASICDEGHDFMAVHAHFQNAITYVRQHKKPYYVEYTTYRYREHVGPNFDFEAGYRPESTFSNWSKKDPLVMDIELTKKFTPSIELEIEQAFKFAENSPWPKEEELLDHVI